MQLGRSEPEMLVSCFVPLSGRRAVQPSTSWLIFTERKKPMKKPNSSPKKLLLKGQEVLDGTIICLGRAVVRPVTKLFAGVALISLLSANLAILYAQEPSYEQAVARWPDLQRPIMFLGCKDHTDEFAVMWNGNLSLTTLTYIDADKRLFQDRAKDSLQVSFAVGEKPNFENREVEDGSTEPSLAEGYLPITRVKLTRDHVALLQEAFVSDEGGNGKAAAWNAPVFLRVRFTVLEQSGTDNSPIHLWAQMAKNHTSFSMTTRRNVRIARVAPVYDRKLRQEGDRLLDDRGLVRMFAEQQFRFYAELPDALNSIALREFQLDKNVTEFSLPRKTGAVLELTFPFIPVSGEKIASVRRLAYAKARASVEKFWKDEIGRGMQVEVPEEPVNNLWRFSVPLGFITADTYPNGEQVLKLSAHEYEAIWPVGNAIHLPELIQRGYLEEAAAFLEIYLDPERRRPVPNTGTTYTSMNGFITAPSEYVAVGWVPDHGAILWTASEYFLLTREEKFLDRWLRTLLEGVEWIRRERAITKLRGGIDAGLMPPGRATDAAMQYNFVFNDAWMYRGLADVCRVLKAVNHKETQRCEQERDDYRATFQRAFRNAIRQTVRWTDASGAQIPFVPWELRQTNADDLHVFYLDGGPLFAGVAGLLNPDDEIMTWALKWLTEGPDSKSYSPDWSDWSERPSLPYEMASSEPALSWNIPLRFLRNERQKFLEGFYSLCAGAVSRRFMVGHETRNGIQGMALVNATINIQLRNILVFEQEEGRGIDLLRNSPSAWLGAGKRISVKRAQTYFGPISYEIRAGDGRSIEAEIEAPSRDPVDWIRLHLYHPEDKPLKRVSVNGLEVPSRDKNTVEIKNPRGTIKVVAEF
jgi:hypothetical protein